MLYRKLTAILAVVIISISFLPTSLAQSPKSMSFEYYLRGVEAAEWISSFAITPPEAGWGIPYHNSSAWGLDPFWYDNATIMGGAAGITAGEKQNMAFLIGGHDSGLAAQALLRSYLFTKDPAYLARFTIYLDYFRRAQMPSPHVAVRAISNVTVGNLTFLIDNSGYFAEQSNVLAGKDGIYGTQDDNVVLVSSFPSPEHGNPIAKAIILYYDITGDKSVLPLLTKYAEWLLRIQVKSGNYSGAFPVTPQSYIQRRWLPRMFETTESATVLLEMHRITENATYLRAAENAAKLMLRLQYDPTKTNDTKIDGSLPYIWAGTRFNPDPLTNHAGYSLSAWILAHQFTGNSTYLYGQGGTKERPTGGAAKYAEWLLSWQTTSSLLPWGDHSYSNDTNAIGGFYYAYNVTGRNREGFAKAQAVWSAAGAISPLLQFSEITGLSKYRESAKLAAEWLAKMRYDDAEHRQVQGLTIFKTYRGSWWGLYPQSYMPDAKETQILKDYVQKGSVNITAISKPDASKTWFERTFSIDFNIELFKTASKGIKYMKMMWSWWPDLGFEPRYGGDVARGYFDMANYLHASDLILETGEERASIKTVLAQVSRFGSEIRDAIAMLAEADSYYSKGVEHFQQGRWELSVQNIFSAKDFATEGMKALNTATKNSIERVSTEANLLGEYSWFSPQARTSYSNALTSIQTAERALNQGNALNALESASVASRLLSSALQVDAQERLNLLARTRNELNETSLQLANTRNQLTDVSSQLNIARNQMQETNSVLQNTREALANTNRDLENTKAVLDATRRDATITKASLEQTANTLKLEQERTTLLMQELNSTEAALQQSNKDINAVLQLLQQTQIGVIITFLLIIPLTLAMKRRR
ncbi:MAG: hypothetical protein FJ358_01485 [Thaumarchaeota archaeon]|nr:hypothetical protein [Nitrososphaerota archaeon]